jgi:hypothetical protein
MSPPTLPSVSGNTQPPPGPGSPEQLAEEERERLRTVAEILRYEQRHGTWETIKRYSAVTGQIPGRNVWVQLRDGHIADLCWAFDVAVAAGHVQAFAGLLLSPFGRPGEFLSAVLGQSAGGLAYPFGRLIGAIAEGIDKGEVRVFMSYLRGSLNEDNIGGAAMALELAWGNAYGGSLLTIRDMIHPTVLEEIRTRGF